jgi:hypothetical protein
MAVSVTAQMVVSVERTVFENFVLAMYLFHQLILDLRHVTISDQHFSTSGIGLAQLTGVIGRSVLDVNRCHMLFESC